MQPHQQRVVTERSELAEKLAKLIQFFNTPIFSALDFAEQSRLWKQRVVMAWYVEILDERIADFK